MHNAETRLPESPVPKYGGIVPAGPGRIVAADNPVRVIDAYVDIRTKESISAKLFQERGKLNLVPSGRTALTLSTPQHVVIWRKGYYFPQR
ncbi:MAG: hypothetical protein OXC57_12690 [Rhodobacteraceae bacterium]|nr:hypothetical protein [Paracoccaceae bacterium]